MKNMGRQAWKNNFFSLLFKMLQLQKQSPGQSQTDVFFFPSFPPTPRLSLDGVTFSRAQLKNLWKKKHTQSQALEVSGAEDYRSSNWLPLSKLQLHKRWYSVSAQGSKGLFPVLKNDAGLEKTQLCCDQPRPCWPSWGLPPHSSSPSDKLVRMPTC